MMLLMILLTTITAWAENDAVTYIDMNGVTQTVTDYTEVTSAMTADANGNINWTSGTYVVKSDVTLIGSISFTSNVIDLIVCDGKTLTVNGNSNSDGAFSGNTLNIYAQSNGTGMGAINANRHTSCSHLNIAGGTVTLDAGGDSYGLYIYSGSDSGLTVNGGDVTILNNDTYFGAFYFYGSGFFTLNGGKLTVTNSKGSSDKAIHGNARNTINFNGGTAEINGYIYNCQNINLNGGNVTVKGEIYNSARGYTVTYDFTSATDSYYIQSFSNNISSGETRTVKVADGKGMKDSSGNIYSCTLTNSKISAISGKTLTPATEAEFRAIVYTIDYYENGGTMPASYDKKYTIESPDITLPTPTRTGFIFAGWYTNSNLTGTAVTTIATGSTGDKEFWAKWNTETYYVDENGTRHDNVTASVLTGSETTLAAGTYLVNSDITYDHTLKLGNGTVNIILADGKKMSIGTLDTGIRSHEEVGNENTALHIYGQTTDNDAAGSMEIYSWHSSGILGINSYTQHSGNVKCVTQGTGILVRYFTLDGGKLTVSGNSGDGIFASYLVTIKGGVLNATNTSIESQHAAIFCQDDITINGGQVTATGTNGSQGIKSQYGDITLGYTNADDFILASSYSVASGKNVKIKDGQTMTDGTNSYNDQTPSATLEALTSATLRPACTVTFDINYGEGTDPETQIVLLGKKTTEPTVDARTGYIFGGWKNGDANYDFNTAVTSNLYLTAEWTPITYTVQFDKNNENASGTMDPVVATFDQLTSIPACTFTAPTGYALKEYGWNTEADGSGDSFYGENGDFRNLANEQDAVVRLYAQWGKDLGTCKADVPDPIYHPYSYHGYFYDGTWNDYHGGIKVYDGETLLTYGTDYEYKMMVSLDGGSCENLDEHCRVYLEGIGAYAGILYKDVVIVPSTVTDAKWGSLTWNLDGDGKFTITGTGAMDAASDNSDYDWYNYSSYFTSITIGEGITTVAAKAFGGDNNTNPYGGVTTVDLPSTLTTIGEKAFAYCTGATFNADELLAQGVTIGDNALNQVGCIVGTLTNNGDNSNMLSLMANARSAKVTIKGRTLYKDGNWNTIYLPFDVKSDNTLLTDATVKELDLFGYYSEEGVYYSYAAVNARQTGFDAENGALYLYFKDATADSDDNLLKAGTPYLIKWPSGGTDITDDLTFEGVKVVLPSHTLTSEDTKVEFRGTFSPVELTGGDASNLYLGVSTNDNDTPEDNSDDFQQSTLYYPAEGHDRTINSFRAYFHVDLSTTSGVRAFVLNFGDNDETTGIIPTTNFTNYTNSDSDAWYDLSGRKLSGKPTKPGLYINNGRKILVSDKR